MLSLWVAGDDSSTRALREVVLVLVRVSVCEAPERSLVTAPMPELVPVEVESVEADGVVSVGLAAPAELELVLGIVELLLGLDEVLEELGMELEVLGDEVLGEELLGGEALLDEDDDDDELGVPSAVRHSVLRCVSVVVLELLGLCDDDCVDDWVDEAELSMELELGVLELGVFAALLGVFAALGVFAVEDGAGVVCVVVDSATRVCSCTVRCCAS